MKLLHVDSSILSRASVSRQISAAVVEAISSAGQPVEVRRRDVASMNLSHINGAYLAAMAAAEPPVKFEDDVELGKALLQEFMEADIVVIGSPMYNFTISSQLKAWLDRIVIAGKTFRYTANGSEGLAGDKRVIVVISRGGRYDPGTKAAGLDFQRPYLAAIFGFMGITEVTFISVDGVTMSPEEKDAAIGAALEEAGAVYSA
jgi:FMN-dependent NADH-azoreductase